MWRKLGLGQQVCISLCEALIIGNMQRHHIDTARCSMSLTFGRKRPHNCSQQPCVCRKRTFVACLLQMLNEGSLNRMLMPDETDSVRPSQHRLVTSPRHYSEAAPKQGKRVTWRSLPGTLYAEGSRIEPRELQRYTPGPMMVGPGSKISAHKLLHSSCR